MRRGASAESGRGRGNGRRKGVERWKGGAEGAREKKLSMIVV